MSLRTIVQLGEHPVLRTPADPVTDFGKELKRLVDDMAETMLHAPGAGLAAPQIGVGLRVFTFHVEAQGSGHVVNPAIEFPDEEMQEGPEGCLSIRGLAFNRRRRMNAVVTGVDVTGAPVRFEAGGFLARCFQHEMDHLDGVLYIDGLDPEDRRAALRALRASGR